MKCKSKKYEYLKIFTSMSVYSISRLESCISVFFLTLVSKIQTHDGNVTKHGVESK